MSDAATTCRSGASLLPGRHKLVRYWPYDRIGRDRFYPTVGTAVYAYLEEHDVPWTD
jgi:hypothetical protein